MENRTKKTTWFALAAVLVMLAVPFAAVAGSADTGDDWISDLIPASHAELPGLAATPSEEVAALGPAIESMLAADASALVDAAEAYELRQNEYIAAVESLVQTLWTENSQPDIDAILDEVGMYEDAWRLLTGMGGHVTDGMQMIADRTFQWSDSDTYSAGQVKYVVTIDSAEVGQLDATVTGQSGIDVIPWGTPTEGADAVWFYHGTIDAPEGSALTGADGTVYQVGVNGQIFNVGDVPAGRYSAELGKEIGNDISPVYGGMDLSVAVMVHVTSEVDYIVPVGTATITVTDGADAQDVIDLMPLIDAYDGLIESMEHTMEACAAAAAQAWSALDDAAPEPEPLKAVITGSVADGYSAGSSTGYDHLYWVLDGVKGFEDVDYLDVASTLEPGSHELRLVVVGSDGTTSEAVVTFEIPAPEEPTGDDDGDDDWILYAVVAITVIAIIALIIYALVRMI